MSEAIAHFKKPWPSSPTIQTTKSTLVLLFSKKGGWTKRLHASKRLWKSVLATRTPAYNLTHMAWVLATSPEASVRNGAKAVALVQQVEQFSKGRDPLVLETLGTAYAEVGRFPEAIAVAERAQQLAAQQGNAAMADILGRQIKLYQAGTPFHDTSMSVAPTPPVSP